MSYRASIRTILLPGSLRTYKAESNSEKGVLVINIAKAEEPKPRQTKIKPRYVIKGRKS